MSQNSLPGQVNELHAPVLQPSGHEPAAGRHGEGVDVVGEDEGRDLGAVGGEHEDAVVRGDEDMVGGGLGSEAGTGSGLATGFYGRQSHNLG